MNLLFTIAPVLKGIYFLPFSIGMQAPSDWGVDILVCHKFAQCPNAQVLKLGYKHTQAALKSKTFAIPASNETTIILKVVNIFKLAYSVTTIDTLNLVNSKNSLKEKS